VCIALEKLKQSISKCGGAISLKKMSVHWVVDQARRLGLGQRGQSSLEEEQKCDIWPDFPSRYEGDLQEDPRGSEQWCPARVVFRKLPEMQGTWRD